MKQSKNIDIIINDALKDAITYNEFVELINELAANNSTTGEEKTEALINYTMLNQRRFKRWNKTLKVNDEAKNEIVKYKNPTTWLVLTESWCGDAAHVMPAMNKVAELNENIDIKVVMRDEHPELMDAFLTNGNRSIPKVIMLGNKTNKVIDTYGPRPSEATKLVNDYKYTYGKLTPEFKEDLQRWYNKDKGQNTIDDLAELLKK